MGERDKEDYLHILKTNTQPLIDDLKTGTATTNKELGFWKTVKYFFMYVWESKRNIIFWVKFLLPLATSIILDQAFYKNVPTKLRVIMYASWFLVFLIHQISCLFQRMTTPGDNLFHIGAYNKFRRREYLALYGMFTDVSFSFSNWADKLKEESNEKDKALIKNYEENTNAYKKEILELKNKISKYEVYEKEYKENEKEYLNVIEGLTKRLETEAEQKRGYSHTIQSLSRFLEYFKNNLNMITREDDITKKILNHISTDFEYSVYEKNIQQSKYILKYNSHGITHDLEESVEFSQATHPLIKGLKKGESSKNIYNRGNITIFDGSVLKLIKLEQNAEFILTLYLKKEQIQHFNNDSPELEFLRDSVIINISTTIDLFMICLSLVYKIEGLTDSYRKEGWVTCLISNLKKYTE